jgi:hypothetical protein
VSLCGNSGRSNEGNCCVPQVVLSVIIYGNSGRRKGREFLCTAGRMICDHYMLIVEGE